MKEDVSLLIACLILLILDSCSELTLGEVLQWECCLENSLLWGFGGTCCREPCRAQLCSSWSCQPDSFSKVVFVCLILCLLPTTYESVFFSLVSPMEKKWLCEWLYSSIHGSELTVPYHPAAGQFSSWQSPYWFDSERTHSLSHTCRWMASKIKALPGFVPSVMGRKMAVISLREREYLPNLPVQITGCSHKPTIIVWVGIRNYGLVFPLLLKEK